MADLDLINLYNMADRLNTTFHRHLDEPIAQLTPYDWWRRTKEERITDPLPKPVSMVGGRPMFRYADIMRWFIRYKGIGVVK